MNKIRFGITGSGFMAHTHAEAIRQQGESASIVAICGGSRAAGMAAEYGAACEKRVEDLIGRRDIDAIVVATPHYMHAAEAIMALEAGKHVLVEKPMATSVADCDRMIESASRRRLVLGTAYQWRFRSSTRRAREAIVENAIGRVLTVQVAIPFNKVSYQDSGFGGNWAWWDNPASIGATLNRAPHVLDLVRWFTGAEIATVFALCRTFLPGRPTEDTTMALLEFSNGALLSLFSSDAMPAPPFPGENLRFRIMGTTGLMDLDPFGELRLADKGGWRVINAPAPAGGESSRSTNSETRIRAFCDQIGAFIATIQGKPSGLGTGNDGKVCVEAILAMMASSGEKRWIQVGRS